MRRIRFSTAHFVFVIVAVAHLAAQAVPSVSVEGVVRDSSGAVIRGATVRLESAVFRANAQTDAQGQFSFAGVPHGPGTIDVTAEGFLAARESFAPNKSESAIAADGEIVVHLEITLKPSTVNEQVMVSAARTEVRLSDTPGSNVLLSTTDVAVAPALRLDDVLREVPGFTLYRRSDSLTANPGSQGVSLRGLGGSAASRALVLADGISLVDPFGGWVYWDRVPRVAVSTVEVVRGGASNLYGSDAMAGVVQLLMRQPEAPAFSLESSYGNERTPDLSFWTGNRIGKWDYSTTTEMFRTDGFFLVPFALRGPVDQPAKVENATIYALIGHDLGANGRIFGRGNYFTEFRNNGTQIQTNDTQIGEGAGGLDKQFGNDSLSLRIYGDAESYDQKYSSITSVNTRRDTETLTDIQHVPEQVVGGGAQWTHPLGKSQTLIGGMDLNEVIGASEDNFFTGKNKSQTGAGRQRALGWFGEDIFHRAKWTVIFAARVDDWSNFAGQTFVTPLSGTPTLTRYPNRSSLAFNPRLSVLRSLNEHVAVTGSIYRAFRAPTLNELYRPFRVGAILTLNNPLLTAERLTGAEAGVNVTGWNKRLDVRGTFFWSDIVDPIENVTIQTSPSILEQKENLGRTRSRGVEIDGELRVTNDVRITAGYAYTAATVLSYPGNPGGENLVGLDVPQVPRQSFTWEARYWHPSRLFASVQGRFVGRQFDDDLNTLPLAAFYTMDLEVGRELKRHFQIFAATENLTGQRYQVARTPIVNLGPPFLFRAGLRINFPAGKQ
ncbi:MAG: TonB-dependent receptor [Terriglobales bacterium]|jgi:outer membrane receptor protein involved in Fe transport